MLLTSDTHQKRFRSLQDLIPEFSSGCSSLMLSDSRNARFSQLFDRRMISVLSRTVLIWSFIASISPPSIHSISTISFQWLQLSKCLFTALCLSVQPCCLVRLKSVDSVLPMYVLEQPGRIFALGDHFAHSYVFIS